MTTTNINSAATTSVLVEILGVYKATSKGGNTYYKVEFEPLAVDKGSMTFEAADEAVRMIRMSEVTYKVFNVSDKCKEGAIVRLEYITTIKDVTEYLDKDGNVQKHTENGNDIQAVFAVSEIAVDVASLSVPKVTKMLPFLKQSMMRAKVASRVASNVNVSSMM